MQDGLDGLFDALDKVTKRHDAAKTALLAATDSAYKCAIARPDDKEERRDDWKLWTMEWKMKTEQLVTAHEETKALHIVVPLNDMHKAEIKAAQEDYVRWEEKLKTPQPLAKEPDPVEKDTAADSSIEMDLVEGGLRTGGRGGSAVPSAAGSHESLAGRKRTRSERDGDDKDVTEKTVEFDDYGKMAPHDPKCDMCAKKNRECVGPPGVACYVCMRNKAKCSLSTGRGGRKRIRPESGVMIPISSLRPKRAAKKRQPSPETVSDTTDEEDLAPVAKKMKGKTRAPDMDAKQQALSGLYQVLARATVFENMAAGMAKDVQDAIDRVERLCRSLEH